MTTHTEQFSQSMKKTKPSIKIRFALPRSTVIQLGLLLAGCLFQNSSLRANPIKINAEISKKPIRIFSISEITVVNRKFDQDNILDSSLTLNIKGVMDSNNCYFTELAVATELTEDSQFDNIKKTISIIPANKMKENLTLGDPVCFLPCIAKAFEINFEIKPYLWSGNMKTQKWSYIFKERRGDKATFEVTLDKNQGWVFDSEILNSEDKCAF